ncbi:MAG: helicase-related protein [Actinomycetota bacterium]|nr:helicase-related protein [Actinomycetota bacterium]
MNLDRSNIVINYDIPWNPTRLIQRVGRINRVDTKFDTIHTFNFFPTKQSNDQIKLKELAQAKIDAFISMLGTDARLLTEGEPIESHELFDRLSSKLTITGEGDDAESELKYLQQIKDLRKDDPGLFDRIKRLPKKARTARSIESAGSSLLTYFRKGKLQKFYLCKRGDDSEELDFISAAGLLETEPEAARVKILSDYFGLLDQNKKAFLNSTQEDDDLPSSRGGRDGATKLLKIIKTLISMEGFTEEQEAYLKLVAKRLEEGSLPKQTIKTALQELNGELKQGLNQFRLLGLIQKNIPGALLKEHIAEGAAKTHGPREVILSEYLVGDES